MRRIETDLETRKARAKLAARGTPYWRVLSPELHLGYRKIESGAGRWVTRTRADGRYAIDNLKTAAGQSTVADDLRDADAITVLNYRQAIALANSVADVVTANARSAEKPITVGEAAFDLYKADLIKRGGNPDNALRLRNYLPNDLINTEVARLLPQSFKAWKKAMDDAGLAKASINRLYASLRAALNLAAKQDDRIKCRAVWDNALTALPGAVKVRHAILSPEQVVEIIAAAYEVGPEFGLFCEVMAVTGARPSQIGRLNVEDLQANRRDPRLMMPRSFKGDRDKALDQRPVAISDGLADRLKLHAKGRAATAPLLRMPKPEGKNQHWNLACWEQNDGRWCKSNHTVRFTETVKRCTTVPTGTTMYALRHSSIVRDLKANVPIQIVAHKHDTSALEIHRHYAAFISDHADEMQRKAMLQFNPRRAQLRVV